MPRMSLAAVVGGERHVRARVRRRGRRRNFALPRVSLAEMIAAKSLGARFSAALLARGGIFPFDRRWDAVRWPWPIPATRRRRRAAEIELGAPVESSSPRSRTSRRRFRSGWASGGRAGSGARARRPGAEESIDSLRDLASGAPVVRAFDDLLEKAVDLRASDIHIEPNARRAVRAHARRRPAAARRGAVAEPPQALISRIKISPASTSPSGGCRRTARRGSPSAAIEIDIRVATMPTQHGESAVIRLLPRDRGLLDIAKLGFSAADERKIRRALDLPHGMIIITGPTGSGKTTTLATMLSALNTPSRKILTIEDPIEYEIPGINQSQVKPAIGLTFAAAMRAFVRQDPDVIMVGEVRDAETANIAVHAALTGHLVLTTLHTETAPAAAPRLIDLGVEGFLLKSTLRAVLAQRLVRVLCERCKIGNVSSSRADLDADPRYRRLRPPGRRRRP